MVHAATPVSAGARDAHGYTNADLADAPPFSEVWPRFRDFVGRTTLVAHNAQRFDIPVLRRAAAGLAGIGDLVFLDTYPLARALFRESSSLSALAQRFGIEAGRSHHAEDDAVTLARVYEELGRRKIVRARKTALNHVLDYLGLAMALDQRRSGAEYDLFRETGELYALGRFSDCLEFYAAERSAGAVEVPAVEQVIQLLGGVEKMERVRARKTASQRYPEAMARLERLLEASASDSVEESLTRFLEKVVLSTSAGGEADPHRVNLLTLHSTKGLEFSRVYILGVEDDQLPGSGALQANRKSEIEEHRRLLYVGMTRAKDRLVMTRVEARNGRPAGKNRFLDEMGIVPENREQGRGNREE
jgi:DNA polymerase III epsilon subunit-like protein